MENFDELEKPTGSSPKTVNNSVFIGSTADLQKIIKQGNINKK